MSLGEVSNMLGCDAALIVHNSSGSQGTTVAGKASFSLTALRNRSPQTVAFLRKTTLGCSLLSFSLPRSLRCVSESKLNSLLLDFQTTEAGCFSLLAKGQGLTPNPAAGGEKCWGSSLQAGSKASTPHQATAIGVFQAEQMIREGWEDGKMLPARASPLISVRGGRVGWKGTPSIPLLIKPQMY